MTTVAAEEAPLLTPNHAEEDGFDAVKTQRWRASPNWLIPVVVIASLARGMTLAPKVQVYMDVACRAFIEADCASPAVQAKAAGIQASVTTVMSVLSAITTGPWSRYGDLHGRKVVLVAAIAGALAMDIIFILVTREGTAFARRAERIIMAGPVLDGMVGGHSSFNGVIHAYASDCTEHGSRSKIFATLQGVMFVGLALGPWMSSFILLILGQATYSLFWVSAAVGICLLIFVTLMLPESLNRGVRPQQAHPYPRVALSARLAKQKVTAMLKSFITPITIFVPRRGDFNVTFLGLGLFVYLISIGLFQIKYLYAKHVYDWTATELGFYMSVLWVTRALNLLVLLPIIISHMKPKREGRGWIYHEMRFDKAFSVCSLIVDGTADLLVALAPRASSVSFILLSCVSSLTSGGNPTMHSLGAVCLHASGRSDEVGSLFGALAVTSAIAHTISPALYAFTYALTVDMYPRTIFWLAAALLATAAIFVGMIRSSSKGHSADEEDSGQD